MCTYREHVFLWATDGSTAPPPGTPCICGAIRWEPENVVAERRPS